VERGLTALSNNSVSKEDAPYLLEHIAKFEINRALWNIKAGHPKKARDILRDCETSLFYKRKIHLMILSYIPSSMFNFLWKNVRTIKQYLSNRDRRISG
jgi:hypothetical protein